MIKVGRPVLIMALLAVVAVVAILLTEPDTPKRTSLQGPKSKSSGARKDSLLREDLEAEFPRMGAARRNAFKPLIVPSKRGISLGATSQGPLPGWVLTGMTVFDGSRVALMENSSTGESAFLKAGATWNGLSVAALEPEAVVFVRSDGERVRCTFPAPDSTPPDSSVVPVVVAVPPAGAAPLAPSAPGTPSSVDIPADAGARAGRRRNR